MFIFRAFATAFELWVIPVIAPVVAVVENPRKVFPLILKVPGPEVCDMPIIPAEVAEAPVTAQFTIVLLLQLKVAVLKADIPCKPIQLNVPVVAAFVNVIVLLL